MDLSVLFEAIKIIILMSTLFLVTFLGQDNACKTTNASHAKSVKCCPRFSRGLGGSTSPFAVGTWLRLSKLLLCFSFLFGFIHSFFLGLLGVLSAPRGGFSAPALVYQALRNSV